MAAINGWDNATTVGWQDAYTANSSISNVSYVFSLPEVASAVARHAESALEWLDRRVNEMRVAL